MIVSLIALLATGRAVSGRDGPVATDFFPLTPGLRTTYSDTASLGDVVVKTVGAPTKIGPYLATPIVTTRNGQKTGEADYIAHGAEMDVVAYGTDDVLSEPQPFFKLGTGREHWSYHTMRTLLQEPVPLDVQGESEQGGLRKVLDQSAEVLNVTLNATTGAVKSQSYKERQEVVLGKNIGLVEMKETVSFLNAAHSHVLTLVQIERENPAK